MTELAGSDIPSGDEVKWYAGGMVYTESHTVSAGEATAECFPLTKKAEYGSVWARIGTTNKVVLEYSDGSKTAATETTDTTHIGYTGIAENDVVELLYLDVETSDIVHIAAAQDVKFSLSIDSRSVAVSGQVPKVKKTGAYTISADLEELDYNNVFLAAVFGRQVSDSPDTGDYKWSEVIDGVTKIGALVGKRWVSGVMVKKYIMFGCMASKIDQSLLVADFYAKSFSFTVDDLLIMQEA